MCGRDVLRRAAPKDNLVRWYVSNKGYDRGCFGPKTIHECWGCGYRLGDSNWTRRHRQEYAERLERRLESERRAAEVTAVTRAAREAKDAALLLPDRDCKSGDMSLSPLDDFLNRWLHSRHG